jgi:hypothetical protein
LSNPNNGWKIARYMFIRFADPLLSVERSHPGGGEYHDFADGFVVLHASVSVDDVVDSDDRVDRWDAVTSRTRKSCRHPHPPTGWVNIDRTDERTNQP